MGQDGTCRFKVRAGICLSPGWLRVEILLEPVRPGFVRLGPHIPSDVPLDLVPVDLRQVGSVFWMVVERGEVVECVPLEDGT